MMKRIFILLFIATTQLYAIENIDVAKLLHSYLENDSELQILSLSLQKAQLSLERTEIDNGFNINLSTGTVVIRNIDGKTKITAKPQTDFSFPAASNLSFKASTEYSNTLEDANFSNTTFSVSVDILSKNPDAQKIAEQKAMRNVTLAKRRLSNRAITAEKEFYTQLKTLLSSTNQLIQSETNLYSDTITFEETKAKGYSETSSTYRLAQMKVLSDEHSIESGKRSLLHDFIVFYMNCGYEIEFALNDDFLSFIPYDLPVCQPLNALDYPEESFEEIENANWTYYINSWERKQNKTFSLNANGGYTINNTSTNSNTVDAGLSSSVQGVNVNGGINIPVSGEKTPSYNFGLSFNPNTIRKNRNEKLSQELTEQQELLAIQTARTNYEATIVKLKQNLEQILWEKETNEQNYEMYKNLTTELEQWYNQGFIKESEYLSAKTNMQLYSVKKLINQLEIIIYNNDLQQMFISDKELEA